MKDNMFKKLKRGGKKSGDVDGVENVVITKVDKTKIIKDACRSGNILQLVSRVTGHSLQWMSSKETIDGLGCLDNDASTTLWTVNLVSDTIKEGIVIQLHNEGNFLSIVDGETKLTKYDDASAAGNETLLKVSIFEQFVSLEAADDCGHHIGVLNNGDLKAAIATGSELESHFAPKVIHSAPIENGEQIKSSTEVIDGSGVELEPVENQPESDEKPKEEVKEETEEKPEKKKSKLKKLKESFRKRSKSQELLTPRKEVSESKENKEEIEVTDNVEPAEAEDIVKSDEVTTEVTDTDISEAVDTDKIEVLESTNESEAVTITS